MAAYGPDRRLDPERPVETPFNLVSMKREPPQHPPLAEASALGYQAGDVIAGKYELVRMLGQGGMCAVWVVQNLILDAQFALKVIQNDGGEAHAAERMLREARSAARVEHPAIIRVFDFGITDRGDPFIVMELLSGVSIRDRLRAQGKVGAIESVRLLLPIAEALAVAHSHGVVHRDLKPDNIVCVQLESGRLQPKLIDFGIAKRVDDDSTRITQTGMVLGSPEYMSPEQALGLLDVDHHTDIWSFSVVLFEMLTGTTPFVRGGELATILQAVVEQPMPPMGRFGAFDPELWSIVVRGLEKVPNRRWEDMRSLGQALARWLIRQGVDDDACTQSVRMVWLGNSPSAPPVAIDTPHATRARLAALSETYDVPKKSMWRTMLGVVAAVSIMTFIGAASFYASRAKQTIPKSEAPNFPAEVPAAPRSEPLPPPPLPAVEPAPAPEPASPGPSAGAEPSASAAAEPPPPTVGEGRSTSTGESDSRAKRRAASESRSSSSSRSATPVKPRRPAARHAVTEPSLAPTPTEPRFDGTTALPELKPPPDFGSKSSDNPYGQNEPAKKKSDNPYVDDRK